MTFYVSPFCEKLYFIIAVTVPGGGYCFLQ
nr:MAG TPA: claudin-3 [Caudoviricetes sp.]